MKINFKKTLLFTLIAAVAVNATVITSMESDKRKQILSTDVESQALLVDPIGAYLLFKAGMALAETIKNRKDHSGPLSELLKEECTATSFSAHLNKEGVTKNEVDSYLGLDAKKIDANANYKMDKEEKVRLSAELVNQYFPMEPHYFAYCTYRGQGYCKAFSMNACTDQFEKYMKTIKKFK